MISLPNTKYNRSLTFTLDALPLELQEQLFNYMSPILLESYPWKKKFPKTQHSVYFRVVLDELLLMTEFVKDDLETERVKTSNGPSPGIWIIYPSLVLVRWMLTKEKGQGNFRNIRYLKKIY